MGAVACTAETLRRRVDGHRAGLDEGDGGMRKERLRGMAKRREEDGSFILSKSSRYLPRHTEPLRV
jgi:hypothetical protein